MREQRFCVCGWSVFGNDLERRNAFAQHRASAEHQKRIDEATVKGVDALVEAEIDALTVREGAE